MVLGESPTNEASKKATENISQRNIKAKTEPFRSCFTLKSIPNKLETPRITNKRLISL